MTVPRKEKKREARREEKAEKAAVLEKNIEKAEKAAVLEKNIEKELKRGVYGDIYNYPVNEYNKVHDMEALSEDEEDAEPEIEYVEGYDELEVEDDMEDFGGFANNVSFENNDDSVEDDEEEAFNKKRVRRSEYAGGKLEKDEAGAS